MNEREQRPTMEALNEIPAKGSIDSRTQPTDSAQQARRHGDIW